MVRILLIQGFRLFDSLIDRVLTSKFGHDNTKLKMAIKQIISNLNQHQFRPTPICQKSNLIKTNQGESINELRNTFSRRLCTYCCMMLPFLMPPVLTKLSSLPVPSVVSHLTALAELRSGAASVFLLLLAATADSDILYPRL